MAKIKWSQFPNVGTNVSGDVTVGLRAGANVAFNPITPQQLQTNAFNFAQDTGIVDAYIANLNPAVASLTAGLTAFVKIANSNTGASTLTINGNTAPIVTTHNLPLTANLLIANQLAVFVYSTALNAFILINPAIIPVVAGGTGNTSIGANGTLAQSDGTKYTFTTATYPNVATSAGTILRANGTNWVASSSTFADAYAASSLLYSNGANAVTGLATANSATLVTNSSGVPSWTASMTNGQVLIGSTGATPVPATLTAGSGISITTGPGSITVATTGGGTGITWAEVTGTTQAMAVNYGYIANNAGLVTMTLPSTAAVGSMFYVQGKGAGGWKIAQNAGQQINFGSVATTSGTGGYLASSAQYDSICLVCITANTTFAVLGGPQGAITYV